jgi:hypothetical protein
MMDEDGYPYDAELGRIAQWPHTDIPGLIDYVIGLWHYPNSAWRDGEKYCFATGGWSGNESIMDALAQNHMFWTLCWQLSERGGYYEFEIPEAFREASHG